MRKGVIALFISLFLGSYNQFIIHSEPGTIPLSNILEPLDNIYIGSVGTGSGNGIIPNSLNISPVAAHQQL